MIAAVNVVNVFTTIPPPPFPKLAYELISYGTGKPVNVSTQGKPCSGSDASTSGPGMSVNAALPTVDETVCFPPALDAQPDQ